MKKLILLPLLFLSFAQAKPINRIPVDIPEHEFKGMVKTYQESDKQLNKIYIELYRSLKKPDQERLKQSELSWIKYRDNYCEFRYKLFGNFDTEKYACLRQITEQRIVDLTSTNCELYCPD